MRRVRKSLAPALLVTCAGPLAAAPADLVVTGAKIYTAGPNRAMAEALAVSDGKIVFVGDDKAAKELIGANTKVEKLDGKLVLPGLFDSHIHPIAILDLETCDLKSQPKSLAGLAAFASDCLVKYPVQAGHWLAVRQWDFSQGNDPDPQHPTLRAALDSASKDVPIVLLGNDGHHGAFNSAGLARAKNARGQTVGLSRATLDSDFALLKPLVGVDERGEPNGAVNEIARQTMDAPNLLLVDFDQTMQAPQRVTERLNSVGITGIMDAVVPPETLTFYDTLAKSGKLTVRATLAQYYDPEFIRTANGQVDYDRMLASAKATRAKYAANPLIRADFIKLFADGVLEGNPFAVPPTLPEGAALKPYLQPIFGKDGKGQLTVTGYVDTDSPLCNEVRTHPEQYAAAAAAREFIRAHGFHPDQCAISSGKLEHDRDVIMEFVRRFHLAGFTLHIHAIGDRAVRVAVDAIEGGRAADGISSQHDSLAHVQVAHPDDVARIGRNRLYVAFTYSWANALTDYDMTVVPFFGKVQGNSYAQLHQRDSYYERAVYPVRSVQQAGGILVAGSDAPVNTRDPQPFVNMAFAVTRAIPGSPPESPWESVPIRDVIDAYTINGARFLSRDREAGSIEEGKSADFIVLDQDILKLADSGHADKILRTQVLETWFQGRNVYTHPKKR
jgi:predicted amidohydrolase YtcJ